MAHSQTRRARIVRNLAFVAVASAAAMLGLDSMVATAQVLPSDAQLSCTVPSATFSGWFDSGSPSLNGVVHEANSVTFPNTTIPPGSPPLNTVNCNFYQWSKQMFMWLTSPAPQTYGGGKYIFASGAFFGVSPAANTSAGTRHLISQGSGPFLFAARLPQQGPHGLPVVTNSKGQMFEVRRVTLPPGKKLQLRDAGNRLVTITGAVRAKGGLPQLLGPDKKPVQLKLAAPTPGRELNLQGAIQHNRFSGIINQVVVNHVPILFDADDQVVQTEEGQAGGGNVLVTQPTPGRPTGTIVYYLLQVNDVYGYFLAGNKTNAFTASEFPTTPSDLAQIVTFAATRHKILPDANALAVELKSSWVEAASLPDPQDYVTMTATIPVYNQPANSYSWTPTGQTKTVLMAMLGMHVVGSTNGHPEMIWATFEHYNNAPDNCYAYVNTSGATVNSPPYTSGACPLTTATTGAWTLTPSGTTSGFNPPTMVYDSATGAINSNPSLLGAKVGPLPVLRWYPWGASSDVAPNTPAVTVAGSNTEIISINNNINTLMSNAGAGADVRDNYRMIGATWTANGLNPTLPTTKQVGTNVLNNATMETFQQGVDGLAADGTNCFSCHTGNYTAGQPVPPDTMLGGNGPGGGSDGGLSHIYYELAPVIPPSFPFFPPRGLPPKPHKATH
jgi:mono/diheme cytochrome c family protein